MDGAGGILATKILSQFAFPLGLVCGLLAAALILPSALHARWGRLLCAGALIVLWTASLPPVSNWAIRSLESQNPPRNLADTPAADAAILLGGGLNLPGGARHDAEFNDGGDRVVHAARLYKGGKVRTIVVTGGNLPWVSGGLPEATYMQHYLMELGVPEHAIKTFGTSRTTAENAQEVAAMWPGSGLSSALLVTSAAHMPRAVYIFKRAGLPVAPSSTDVRGAAPQAATVLDVLPDAGALHLTTQAAKEWLGLLVERLRDGL